MLLPAVGPQHSETVFGGTSWGHNRLWLTPLNIQNAFWSVYVPCQWPWDLCSRYRGRACKEPPLLRLALLVPNTPGTSESNRKSPLRKAAGCIQEVLQTGGGHRHMQDSSESCRAGCAQRPIQRQSMLLLGASCFGATTDASGLDSALHKNYSTPDQS